MSLVSGRGGHLDKLCPSTIEPLARFAAILSPSAPPREEGMDSHVLLDDTLRFHDAGLIIEIAHTRIEKIDNQRRN